MNIMYGIAQCSTVQKAKKWLIQNKISFNFHDYRKDGLTLMQLQKWSNILDWNELLNKRSTVWREISQIEKKNIDKPKGLLLMMNHPTLIKRPLLSIENKFYLGFNPTMYQSIFSSILNKDT